MAWLSNMFKPKDGAEGAEGSKDEIPGATGSMSDLKAEVLELQAELSAEKAKTERAARDQRQLEKALRQLITMANGEEEKPTGAAPKAGVAQALREELRNATTKDGLLAVVKKCEDAGMQHEAEMGRKKAEKM
jgi:hypothetical protein